MKNIFKLAGIIVIAAVIGFSFACGNGSTDPGSAPKITAAIVSDSQNGAHTMTATTTFSSNATIYVGVTCEDPDGDIVKIGFNSIKAGQADIPSLVERDIQNFDVPASFSGWLLVFGTEDTSYWSGTGHKLEVYVIDSKGNKSNLFTTNEFACSDGPGQKTLVIQDIPANVWNHTGNSDHDDFLIINAGDPIAAADLKNNDITVTGTGPYAVSIPLYKANTSVRWTGSGTYRVYISFNDDGLPDYEHGENDAYGWRNDSVTFDSNVVSVNWSTFKQVIP